MKRKLYYVVDKEISSDLEDELTGNKTISVYEIIDNVPKNLCTVECQNSDSSVEEIQSYLDDNGFGDEAFEFIQL